MGRNDLDVNWFHFCLLDRECRRDMRDFGMPLTIRFGSRCFVVPFTDRTKKVFGNDYDIPTRLNRPTRPRKQ